MQTTKPLIPLPPNSRKNLHFQPTAQKKSRQKSRKGSKNGVTLARDHSIRFDKQYQDKHLMNKSGLRVTSSRKKSLSGKQLQDTTVQDQSTMISHSKSYRMVEQTPVSNQKFITQTTLNSISQQKFKQNNDDAKSMTSLDQNHPRQIQIQKIK